MTCAQCQGIEGFFDRGTAERNLRTYRKRGPDRTTRLLIEALESEGVAGLTLLDIGGGIGVIQCELLKAGAAHATDVDASSAYLTAAQGEAERQGLADRVEYRRGNFVDLAPELASADIVTLDRVVCCYHDPRSLVGLSAAKAAKLYGLVYPRDTWWSRTPIALVNLVFRLRRNPFRIFVHPTAAVDGLRPRRGPDAAPPAQCRLLAGRRLCATGCRALKIEPHLSPETCGHAGGTHTAPPAGSLMFETHVCEWMCM